jgi:succinate-semialdehyde dehydrogenase/glutarate-semialdehyde dehydrogenase
MPLHSINPATGDLLRSFPTLTDEALRARIAQSADASAIHRNIPLDNRSLYLRKLAVMLQDESAELARTITLETGKPIRASVVEVQRCVTLCRYYADNATRLLAPELLQSEQGQSYVQWSPLGVVLAVMPWESPLWHAVRFAVPALIAGNVVLLKMAASVPQCALVLEALVRRAGFERGVMSALLIEERQVEFVLNDERVAAVSVTGSDSTGRAIAAQAGWLLKRSALQLSGSDAMVIMPSANLDEAAAAAALAFTGVEGTSTAKRLIIHAGIYNDFVHKLVAAVEVLKIGDPSKDETEIGPLGSAEALKTLSEQVEAAVTAGGRIVTGGAKLVGDKGHFFEPTLLSDVPRTATVARDAIAGPVAMLFRAQDLADAIAIANDSPYGLSASVWTKEPVEQQALINGVDAGTVTLNALPTFDPRLPVGGSKRSGYGRELGGAGIRECMQAKTVSIGQ